MTEDEKAEKALEITRLYYEKAIKTLYGHRSHELDIPEDELCLPKGEVIEALRKA